MSAEGVTRTDVDTDFFVDDQCEPPIHGDPGEFDGQNRTTALPFTDKGKIARAPDERTPGQNRNSHELYHATAPHTRPDGPDSRRILQKID